MNLIINLFFAIVRALSISASAKADPDDLRAEFVACYDLLYPTIK